MSKINLPNVPAGYGLRDAVNRALQEIEYQMNNSILYRGTHPDEDNEMLDDLDMNGNDILNAKTISADSLLIGGQDIVEQLVELVDEAARHERDAAQSALEAADSASSAGDALADILDIQDEIDSLKEDFDEKYEDFSSKYLGAFEEAPTEDILGNPVVSGALYFNTLLNVIFVYDGDSWNVAGIDPEDFGTAALYDVGLADNQIPTNADLGSAAYAEVGSSADALATNLQVFTILRSLGINSTLIPLDGQYIDDTGLVTGNYSVNFAGMWENNPFGVREDIAVINLLKVENTCFQIALCMSSNEIAWRSADDSTTFSSWSYLPTVLQTTGDSTTIAMSQKAVTDALQWQSKPIGSVLSMRYGTIEPPKDNSLYRYVKLTANQTGSGQYNEGILTNQTTIGSGATLRITAKINFPSSPLHDTTIDLTNSCSIATEAGTPRGVYDGDKIQNITGEIQSRPFADSGAGGSILAGSGAFTFTEKGSSTTVQGSISIVSGARNRDLVAFSASNSARTGTRTKPKTVTEEEYLRIL